MGELTIYELRMRGKTWREEGEVSTITCTIGDVTM